MKKYSIVFLLLILAISFFPSLNSTYATFNSTYASSDLDYETIIFDENGGECEELSRRRPLSSFVGENINIAPNSVDNISFNKGITYDVGTGIYTFNYTNTGDVAYHGFPWFENSTIEPIQHNSDYTFVLEILTFNGPKSVCFSFSTNIPYEKSNFVDSFSNWYSTPSTYYFTTQSTGTHTNFVARNFLTTDFAGTYNITFKLSLYRGIVTENDDYSSVAPGQSCFTPLPTPTRENYIFDGWYTDGYFGTKLKEDDTMDTAVNTYGGIFYAHWIRQYDNTYNYNSTISTDYSTTFLNGIDSVEYVRFDYYTYVTYTFENFDNFVIDFGHSLDFASDTSIESYNAICFKINQYDYIHNDNTYFPYNIVLLGNFNRLDYSSLCGRLDKMIITDLNVELEPGSYSLPYVDERYFCKPNTYYTTDSSLSSYLDLDSKTNYSYEFYDNIEDLSYEGFYTLLDFFDGGIFSSGYYTPNVNCGNLNVGLNCVTTDSSYWTTLSSNNSRYSYILYWHGDKYPLNYNKDVSLVIQDFEILIDRPVNRLENTLVLYTYDYDCALSSVNSIEYALSKDNDLYKTKYTGSIPNNRYIGLVCNDLQNRLYDDYIYLYLTFDNNVIQIDDDFSFELGFDFNFSKYYEPFVIKDTELNDYNVPTLNKPGNWWDLGGWIQYFFVWSIFYNPIISPISKFITSIFGLFMKCFNFIINLPLGNFLLAFIGFMILYNFFTSVVPFKPNGINWLDSSSISSEKFDKKYDKAVKEKNDKVHSTLSDATNVKKLRNKVQDKWAKNSAKVQKQLDKKRK